MIILLIIIISVMLFFIIKSICSPKIESVLYKPVESLSDEEAPIEVFVKNGLKAKTSFFIEDPIYRLIGYTKDQLFVFHEMGMYSDRISAFCYDINNKLVYALRVKDIEDCNFNLYELFQLYKYKVSEYNPFSIVKFVQLIFNYKEEYKLSSIYKFENFTVFIKNKYHIVLYKNIFHKKLKGIKQKKKKEEI